MSSCPVVLFLSSLWDRETVTKKEGLGLPLLPLKTQQVGKLSLSQSVQLARPVPSPSKRARK